MSPARYLVFFLAFFLLSNTAACKRWKSLGDNIRYEEIKDDNGAVTHTRYQRLHPDTGFFYDAEKNEFGRFEFTMKSRHEIQKDKWQQDMQKKYGKDWEQQVTTKDEAMIHDRHEEQFTKQERDGEAYQKVLADEADRKWKKDMEEKHGYLWDYKLTQEDLDNREQRVLKDITNPSLRVKEKTALEESRKEYNREKDWYDKMEAEKEKMDKEKEMRLKARPKIYDPVGGKGQSDSGSGGERGGGHP